MTRKFSDYLNAKKSVDDRALNRQVLDELQKHLTLSHRDRPLQVLEIAAGTGTMLERLVGWKVLGSCVYTAVDLQPELLLEARHRLPRWAQGMGFDVQQVEERAFLLRRADQTISVGLAAGDIFEFLSGEGNGRQWDLLIANAFLDLVDPARALPELFAALTPGGFYYFTINFDGQTILLPEIDPPLDQQIIAEFHRSMDDRLIDGRPTGGSRTGRFLFNLLPEAGAEIIAAGSSDWVVYPREDGYPLQEGFFLNCILDMFQASVQPRVAFDIEPWIGRRRQQIADHGLIYIAHQFDFFGRLKR